MYQSLGHWEKAATTHQESLDLFEVLGDQRGIAYTLHELGTLEHDRGNLQASERLCQQSLLINLELGDQGGVARDLHQLAVLEQDRGNLIEAEGLYRESLETKQELHDKACIAMILHQLAMLEQGRSNLAEAEKLYRESMKINEEIGDRGSIAFAQGQLGRFYQQQEKWHAALEHSLNAWKMCCELHSPHSKLALSDIQRTREQVGEDQFNEWLTEEFGPKTAKIRKRLDDALAVTSDIVRQEPVAIG